MRAGRAGSGKGAASMVTAAVGTARAAGATGHILVRGDSAYGSGAVIGACVKAGAQLSFVLTKNPAVARAIASIDDDDWRPVHYPGAVTHPDTGGLISDAEVAEVEFTAFAFTKTPVTARLIVRRVRDGPAWTSCSRSGDTTRSSPTTPNWSPTPTSSTDPWPTSLPATLPPTARGAICAVMTHNLLRAAGSLTSPSHTVARGATQRRRLITVPRAVGSTATSPALHLPSHWSWAEHWTTFWNTVLRSATGPPALV